MKNKIGSETLYKAQNKAQINSSFTKILNEYKNSTIQLLENINKDDEKSITSVSKNIKKRDILIILMQKLAGKNNFHQSQEMLSIIKEIGELEFFITKKVTHELESIKGKIKNGRIWKEPLSKYYQQIALGRLDEIK